MFVYVRTTQDCSQVKTCRGAGLTSRILHIFWSIVRDGYSDEMCLFVNTIEDLCLSPSSMDLILFPSTKATTRQRCGGPLYIYTRVRAHTVRGRESEHNIYTYRIRTCIVKARNDTVDESCGGVWRLPSKEQPSKKKTTITVLFTSTARGAYL